VESSSGASSAARGASARSEKERSPVAERRGALPQPGSSIARSTASDHRRSQSDPANSGWRRHHLRPRWASLRTSARRFSGMRRRAAIAPGRAERPPAYTGRACAPGAARPRNRWPAATSASIPQTMPATMELPPQIAQDRESGNGNRQQSRCVFSVSFNCSSDLEAKSGQRNPAFRRLARKHAARRPRRARSGHSGGLGTLSGKNECDLHRVYFNGGYNRPTIINPL